MGCWGPTTRQAKKHVLMELLLILAGLTLIVAAVAVLTWWFASTINRDARWQMLEDEIESIFGEEDEHV